MSRPGKKQVSANRRVPATALAAACALTALAQAAWAGRPVRAYEVDVDGQTAAALQEAMRTALVRATGRREAADDPALARVVSDAPQYVKSYATGPRGETQVVFDATAVEQAIGAAGRSVWEHERPFTLVVLSPPRERTAADAARAELERIAAERGLPISLVPLGVLDRDGNLLAADALLHAAERYGGDEILVGRGGGADSGELAWTLYTRSASSSWSGPLAAGIDHTVDLLVPQQASAPAQGEAAARVRIEGATSLNDYAALTRLLQGTPGVRRANIAAADAAGVSFEVMVRGGAAALEQGLAASTHLVRIAASPERLVYRYQP